MILDSSSMPTPCRRPAFTGARHEQHRAARRLGAGWRPSQVAKVLDCDPATIHLLLREDEFPSATVIAARPAVPSRSRRLAALTEPAPVAFASVHRGS